MIHGAAAEKNLAEIQHTLRAILPELNADYGVSSLSVFGSYARGGESADSDLDLLVEFDHAPTIFQFTRLQRRLATASGSKVDLVMRSALKPNIGKQILRELVPV